MDSVQPGTNITIDELYIASEIRAGDKRFCLDRLGEYLDASAHLLPDALQLSDAVDYWVDLVIPRFNLARSLPPHRSRILPLISLISADSKNSMSQK